MEKKSYYNIQLNVLNTSEVLSICQNDILQNDINKLIYFINAHCFNIAQKNKSYLNAINDADILLNDGIGIKIGSFFTTIKLKENMNGTDLIPKILEFSKLNNLNVYLLGGVKGVASTAKKNIEKKLTGITIVGAKSGYFDFNNDDEIVEDINNCKTDILLVGMGVPRQELWLSKNRNKLTGVKISIAGGAILDFLSREITRAPNWMRRTGTEWIYRLVNEPHRLFKRYFIGIPVFFLHIISFTLRKKSI